MSGPKRDHLRSARDHIWSALVDFDGIVAWWRRLYPANTAEHVASDLGAPVTTAKKWILRETNPDAVRLLAAVAFYGPDLIAAGLRRSPAWLDAAQRAQRATDLDLRISEMLRQRDALRAPPFVASSASPEPSSGA